MSRVTRLALILSLTTSAGFAAEPAYDAPRGRHFFDTAKGRESLAAGYVTDELLVRVRPGAETDADRVLGRLGARLRVRHMATGVREYQLPRGVGVREALARLGENSALLRAEPNHVIRTCEGPPPNDPLFPQLWGLRNTGQAGGRVGADVSALSAWAITTGSPEVVVAVIDSGFDYTHPDLADNAWVNPEEVPGNGLDDDGNGYVDDVHGIDAAAGTGDPGSDGLGHGTHVAGTIGAVGGNGTGVVGMSPTVRIIGVKSLMQSGLGVAGDAVRGIDYLIRLKRHGGVNLRAVNASWRVETTELPHVLYEAVRALGEQGVLFVAAAGNQASDDDLVPHWPASFDLDSVISVAASDPADDLALFASPAMGGSNWGRTSVDVAAPGTDVVSTLPGTGYSPKTGTSMAAPHVTGLVALLAASEPQLTGAQVKARILSTVDARPNLQGTILSGGRINAGRALAGGDRTVPSVTVVSPNGGETLTAGEVRALTWSASDESDLAQADVAWSPDGGSTWEDVATGAPATGSLAWRVPDAASPVALVRVRVEDAFGNRGEDHSDATFRVVSGAPSDTTSPTATLTWPNGGETLYGGDTATITWTAADDVGVVSVDLQWSIDPRGWSWNSIATGLPNSGAYLWYVPATSATATRVRVTAWDAAGNSRSDASNATFTLVRRTRPTETVPPAVTVLSPNGGEVWRSGETRVVAWSARDNYSIARTNVYYSLDGGSSWVLLVSGLTDASAFAFVVPEVPAPATTVAFRVEAYDASGNRGEDRSDAPLAFQPRNIPPTAAAGPDLTPAKGTLVTLDGTVSSDPDDGLASFEWAQTSGAPVALSGATAAMASFTAPDAVGAVLVFQLTVRDRAGQAATDSVLVRVLDPSGGTGAVRVRTLTKTGTIRTGVWVQVRQTAGGTLQASAKTDYKGEAVFRNLTPGQYEVSRQTSMGYGDKRVVEVTAGEVVVEYRY